MGTTEEGFMYNEPFGGGERTPQKQWDLMQPILE